MNLSLLNVGLFAVGALLIASAVKDKTPRALIVENMEAARTGKTTKKNAGGLTKQDLDTPTYDEGQRGAYGDDGTEEITPMTPFPVTST